MADEHISPSIPPVEPSAGEPPPGHSEAPAADPASNGVIPPPLPAPVPPITTATSSAPSPRPTQAPKPGSEPKDVYREVFETVVFVVVLVLLLKTFVAEAFVIPTGSMATTLWGYQKYVDCPNCGFSFPVNCSTESDPQSERPRPVTRCECPNCRYEIDFARDGMNPQPHSGDRVLVFKGLYDTGIRSPHRHDVVVFKFPVEPQVAHTPMNYIKRLIGLPGETIAIAQGQLYVYDKPRNVGPPENGMFWARSKYDQYPWPESPDDPAVREANDLFHKGEFKIVRKSPDLMLAMRRIVYDNDFNEARRVSYPARWITDGKWSGEGPRPRTFIHPGSGDTVEWLRYSNVRLGGTGKPELISDFMGYNSGDNDRFYAGSNWVGDLMLETEVQVDQPTGEVWLELARGVDRFQARFNLATGECTLVRLSWNVPPMEINQKPDKETELARKPTALKQPGKYHVRFANFDEQLTVWVNNDLPFGNGVEYPAATVTGPTANDLDPAGIAAKGGAVHIAHLQLWRDTYYTARVSGGDVSLAADAWSDPARWGEFRNMTPRYMYVQPGHYLCLGDNSPASADSRSWGMVPERLMLGRALVVYFPFYFPYWPINSPTNRVGAIR